MHNPVLGDLGDVISVYIHNENNMIFKPYAIRAATTYVSPVSIVETGAGSPIRISGGV